MANDLQRRVTGNAAARPTGTSSKGNEPVGMGASAETFLFQAVQAELKKHGDTDQARILRMVWNMMRSNPKLGECTRSSLGSAIVNASALGLEPGFGGECWIIPRKNSDTGLMEAIFQIGYLGAQALFMNLPDYKSLAVETVYSNDYLRYRVGSNAEFSWVPSFAREDGHATDDRGDVIGWFAFGELKGGTYSVSVLQRKDVEYYRAFSKTPNGVTWVKSYNAMAMKTCIFQMLKKVPRSRSLTIARVVDETVGNDFENPDRGIESLYERPEMFKGQLAEPEEIGVAVGTVVDTGDPANPLDFSDVEAYDVKTGVLG